MSRARLDDDARALNYPAAALTIAFAGLFVLATYTHVYAMAVAVGLAQLVVATTPPPVGSEGTPLHSSRGVPVGLGALVATVLAVFPGLLSGAEGTTAGDAGRIDSGTVTGMGVAVAVVVLTALLAQMVRTDGRAELVATLTDTVSLGVLATFLSGWVAAAVAFDGRAVIAFSALALLVTAALWSIRGSRWILGAIAVLVSAGAGAGASIYVSDVMSVAFGALVGLTVGLFAWLGRAIAHEWRPRATLRWSIEGTTPVALVGPVVFVAGQLYGI